MSFGFDLGTSNFIVCLKGKGIVLQEPMIVALKDNKIVFSGILAKKMSGKENDNFSIVKPIQHGSIHHLSLIEEIIKKIMKNLCGKMKLVRPEVIINIPSGAGSVERKALTNIVRTSGGAQKVKLIKNSLAAGVGAGIDVNLSRGIMIVDIGGGTCDIAVLSLGGVVMSLSIPLGGDAFDKAIIDYIKLWHRVLIGALCAEEVKIKIGTCTLSKTLTEVIVGKDMRSGLPLRIKITSDEIRNCILPHLVSVVGGISYVLSNIDPEILSDIMEHGIVLTGGSAQLSFLDTFIYETTGIRAYVAPEPDLCVIKGIQKIIEKEVLPLHWCLTNVN